MRPLREYRVADWTVAVAGVIAFGLGVLGLVDQDSQLSAVGLDPAAHPAADPLRVTMTSASVAALNTGAVYVLGVAQGWRWLPALTVATRTAQAAGFLVMIATGVAPVSYVGAAVWEAAGAVITAGALLWERRKSA
ncbi:hypothetical protein JNUCC0626_11605 [Lentzea sp. JNUCC 0626]|uniref:hypothetical protein n=1 Tax=Lentzea sp. JNUCC 0626 TaxID=3367513 RepID=UPI003747E1E1